MGAAIGLREDFGSGRLRSQAKMVKDAGQARRSVVDHKIFNRAKGPSPHLPHRPRRDGPTRGRR